MVLTTKTKTMKILKGLLITVLAILAIWVLLALFSTPSTHVERSLEINAPAETVWSKISEFKKWEKWSPWKEKDPTINNTYTGTEGEVGSKMSWVSDSSGVGYMELLEVIPNEKMVAKLAFTEPWESSSEDTFTLSENEGKTTVTWADHMDIPFLARPIMLFMGMNNEKMDEMMGPDFEKGLQNIKALAESDNTTSSQEIAVTKEEVGEAKFLGIRHKTSMSEVLKQEFFATNFGKIFGVVSSQNIQMAGNSSCIYFEWNEVDSTAEAFPCVPVTNSLEEAPEGMEIVTIPAGNVVKASFKGSFTGAMAAHQKIAEYCTSNNIKTGIVYEEYVNAATVTDENEMITNIFYQIIE